MFVVGSKGKNFETIENLFKGKRKPLLRVKFGKMLYKEENFITTFGEEKKRKKLEIVCDLENGKIL